MSTERNKETVRRYAEAFSRGDWDQVLALCTADAVIQGVLGKGGLEVALPIWKDLHHAFGMSLEILELAAEGETVAALFTERGTFRNDFRGMTATGKPYQIVAMEWFHMRDGKIAQRWGARDSAAMISQIDAK